MRLVQAAPALLGMTVMLTACGVPQDVPGTYWHPDAGVIVLGDDGNGVYTRFDGDIRAVRGDDVPATADELRSTTPEEAPPARTGLTDRLTPAPATAVEAPWDSTFLDFRATGDVVRLLPVGGDPVQLTMVDGGLLLMQPGGLELVFRKG